jgi:hypothetical protein
VATFTNATTEELLVASLLCGRRIISELLLMESAVSRQVEMAEDASEQELVASDCG